MAHALQNHFSCHGPAHSSALRDAVASVDPALFAVTDADFSRHGPLTPDLLIALLLFQAADAALHGYRDLLAAFWDDARSRGLTLPPVVSAPAFCQARAKLAPASILAVLHAVGDSFERVHGDRMRWKGRRLLAIDGSSLQLQRSKGLFDHFGSHHQAHRPSVHISTLYDALAGLPLDIMLSEANDSDRSALVPLLARTQKGDVMLLDRAYPSFDDLMWMASEGLDFVVRVKLSLAKPIRLFAESGASEGVITLRPTGTSVLQEGEIALRIVRTGDPQGEPVFLLTTLGNEIAMADEIAWLYTRRWSIEEHYKLTQSAHFGQGFLHARSVRGVEQEIYAQALLLAVTRHLAASAAAATGAKYEEISTKGALLSVASRITVIALGSMTPREAALLLERIARSLEPKRPGRHFPRRSYTPQRKWGPYGRRRDCRAGNDVASGARRVP
jgi:hypothetical protein